jgi:hypothetical protein
MANLATLSASGGLATFVSDLTRATNKAKVLNNVNQVKRGVITSRYRGWQRVRAGSFNAGTKFLGFSEFITSSSGARTLLFQVGDKVYSYNFGTATETQIATGLNTSAIPTMNMFQPYSAGPSFMVYTNGVDQGLKITSTAASAALQLNGAAYGAAATAAALPVKTYTKPKFNLPFLDRMLIWGFDGTDIRHDLLITNSGTAETCTQASPAVATDGDMRQLPPRLGLPTGGFAFRLSNSTNEQVVILAMERGVCLLQGTNATNFSITVLTDEYGIPSNHTWIQLYNDVWFLTTKGLSNFSMLAGNSSLMSDMLTADIQDIMSRINSAQAHKAHAYHHKLNQDVVLWFPLDSNTECNDAIIGNYNNDLSQPGHPVPQWFTKSGTEVTASCFFDGVPYGGNSAGLFQQHYTGALYDTTPVPWEIMLALMGAQDPLADFDTKELGIVCEGASQQFIMNCYQYIGTVNNRMARIEAKPLNFEMAADDTGSLTTLGTWISDLSSFPADQVKVLKQYTPTGVCRFAEYQMSGATADDNIDFVQLAAMIEKLGYKG